MSDTVECDDFQQELHEEESTSGQGIRRKNRRRRHGKKQAKLDSFGCSEQLQANGNTRILFTNSGDGIVWTAVPLAVGPLPFTATPCRNVVTWKDLGGGGVLNAPAGTAPPRAVCTAVRPPSTPSAAPGAGAGGFIEAGARRSPAAAAPIARATPGAAPGYFVQQTVGLPPASAAQHAPSEWTREHSDMMRQWLCNATYTKDGTPTSAASTTSGFASNGSEAQRLEDLLRALAPEAYED